MLHVQYIINFLNLFSNSYYSIKENVSNLDMYKI